MNRLVAVLLILFSLVVGACGCAESELQTEESWHIGQYVDDFGDPTGENYIYTICSGTFSNLATNDSELTVYAYYKSNSFSLRLLEYNSTSAIYSEQSKITLKFKVDDVIYAHQLYPNAAPNGDLVISDWYQNMVRSGSNATNYALSMSRLNLSAYQQMNEFLVTGKDVRCVVTIDDSKYSFTIRSDGFGELAYGKTYKQAFALMQDGDYEAAAAVFSTLGTYLDSNEKFEECRGYSYGPCAAMIESIQSEHSASLSDALTLYEADFSYDAESQPYTYLNMLKTFARCEGIFSWVSELGDEYKLTIKYRVVNCDVIADIEYEGFSGTLDFANLCDGTLSLLEEDNNYVVEIVSFGSLNHREPFVIRVTESQAQVNWPSLKWFDNLTR